MQSLLLAVAASKSAARAAMLSLAARSDWAWAVRRPDLLGLGVSLVQRAEQHKVGAFQDLIPHLGA